MEESGVEENVGASEEERGGSSSENVTERAGNKRLKLEEKQDRISGLPDSLIQLILSFLPSTKEAIQTGILSKRWKNQWTEVPVLIFNSTGKNDTNFSHFIDKTLTLHDCSKIRKFHMQYDCKSESDANLTSKIRFATRKHVEELILHFSCLDEYGEIWYSLPEFLFNNASLVKLELYNCSFGSNQSANWSNLKELKLDYFFVKSSAIGNVVSGCPVLELVELTGIIGFDNVVIASNSLKRLIFTEVEIEDDSDHIEISCPNLEELSIKISETLSANSSELPDQAIENVLSRSSLLHTLELSDCCCSNRFLIASKSLKKLVLGEIYGTSEFEISCPNLEELNLYHFVVDVFPLYDDIESESQWKRCLAMKILEQLQHVKLLEIGSWFIKILSALEVEGLSSPLLNCKCLTLDGTVFDEHLLGIVYAICHSPVLESLVIKLQLDQRQMPGYPEELNDCRKKNYWNSSGTDFNCLVSNLKTVKIIGLSRRDDKHKLVFKFVEFLLKNARMLDKIVVILEDCGTGFPFEVSEELLSFQRCSPHTTIELLCSN